MKHKKLLILFLLLFLLGNVFAYTVFDNFSDAKFNDVNGRQLNWVNNGGLSILNDGINWLYQGYTFEQAYSGKAISDVNITNFKVNVHNGAGSESSIRLINDLNSLEYLELSATPNAGMRLLFGFYYNACGKEDINFTPTGVENFCKVGQWVGTSGLDWNVFIDPVTKDANIYAYGYRYDGSFCQNANYGFIASKINVSLAGCYNAGFNKVSFLANYGATQGSWASNWTLTGTQINRLHNVKFNFYKTGTATTLNSVGVDCNVNAYDTTLNSGDSIDVNSSNYSCSFSKLGYDTNNSFFVQADYNRTINIYLSPLYDLNILYPPTFSYFAGTKTIDINVYDSSDFNLLGVKLAYSNSAGSFTNQIVNDTNLFDANAFTCVDYNLVDYTQCSYNWGTVGVTDSNYYLDVNFYSGLYGYNTIKSQLIGVDNTKPITSWNKDTNSWYGSSQNVSLSCVDGIGAGCLLTQYRYKLLPSGGFNAWQSYTNPIVFDSEGKWHIDFNSSDNVGNVGDTNTKFLFIDLTGPTLGQTTLSGFSVLGTQIWGDGNISSTISDTLSDVNSTGCEYTTNNGTTWASADKNTTHCYKNNLTIVSGTTYDFNFRARDNVNNLGYATKSVTYTADNVKPTITSDANIGWNLLGDANIHLTCSDSLSGDANVYFSVDDNNSSSTNWLPFVQYNDSNILMGAYLNKFDGNFGLRFYCKDNAGNDSNTGTTYDTNYILLEVNSPPTPTVLTPTSGSFSGIINVSCSAPSWIRDYNYSMDYNTSVVAWTNFYDGNSPNTTFDLNSFPLNSNITFRCKIMDADKNSAYLTNTTSILANPNTSFDSISNATPLSPTTIYSASAPFSVTASDSSGVQSCTFEIYKNAIHVLDANGVDMNSGIWYYAYTNISNGDILFSYVSCADNGNNVSTKISSSTYSANIATVVPPAGGGSGGSPPAITTFQVIYDKPDATLYFGKNRIAKIKFSVKNISSQTIEVQTSVIGAASTYFLQDPTKKNTIEPNITRDIEFAFLVDDDTKKVEGILRMNSGSSYFELPLKMQYDEQRDILSQARSFLNYGIDLAGIIVPLWFFIVGALGFVLFISKDKMTKNVIFVILIVVLFLVFSFEFLNLFGVSL